MGVLPLALLFHPAPHPLLPLPPSYENNTIMLNYYISGYYEKGFLTVQQALDQAIIESINSSAPLQDVAITLRRFPYPPYIIDEFMMFMEFLLPFFLILCFGIPTPNLIKDIVLEKENMLKVSLYDQNVNICGQEGQ